MERGECGMSNSVFIRPFTPDDYSDICAVINAIYPEYPETPEEYRHHDETRDAKMKWARYVAIESGRIRGVGSYSQHSGMYHPQKFHMDIHVAPEAEGRGIGKTLYNFVTEQVAVHNPIAFWGAARSDHARGIRFLTDRGYVETMQEQESRVELADFDPSAFAEEIAKVEAQGIVLRTVTELQATDPDMARKLHELHWKIAQDIPHEDTPTQVPFEEWCKRFTNPNFIADGNFVALDGDKYIGISVLWKNQSNDELGTGTTGVLREYRKRGIATALKVRALTYAKERGTSAVRTWNEMNNNGMLGINFRLGFVRQPAWISFLKEL
jgi:GNAT superfamily N-acetyltransferase